MDETVEFKLSDFQNIISKNEGVVIFKFGAEWCAPCKKIEPVYKNFAQTAPTNLNCFKVDVDESFELYAQMKRLKMVKGLPTILAYYKGNLSYVADDSVVGSNLEELNKLFERCIKRNAEINP